MTNKSANLILLFLLVFPVFSFSQNLDSLWMVWNDTNRPDSSRLQAIKGMSWKMKNINPDSAIKLADLMYDLAVEKDYKDMQALAFKTKGISYYFLRQYDSVLIMYNRGIEIAKNAGLRKELANLYNNRGITYNRLGDPVSALESHFNSLEIRMEQGDENLVAFSYSNIGVVYRTQEDFSRALEYFQKSLMISEKISDKDRLASAYQNVGLIYLEIGDNEKAKDYLQKSLVIFLELGNPYRTTFAYNNLGIVYKNNGDYTAARDVYQKGLELSKKSNIKGNIPDLYRNIGNTYRLEKEYDLALTYYHKSLQLYSDYDNKHGVAASYSDIGVIHNKLEEFDQGRIWCEKAYNMGSELDNAQLEDIQNSCDCLHNSYKGLGNMAKAFEFLVKYYEARDSLDIRKNSQEITRLSLKYEFEKQRLSDSLAMEEARLKAELAYLDNLGKEKVQRNTFMYIGIGILLLAGGLFSRLRFVRKTNQTLKEKNKLIEREKKRAEESERTKEQFFANISHEFRTPLTLILGPLEKLLINTTDKKAEHDLLIMKRNATRLQSMINELMNLYKLESGKIKLQSMEKDIVSFLTTYIQSFESLAKQQHIKLSVKSEFRSIPIFYDQEKIEKVITNLLSNAFKFTNEGGEIKLEISSQQLAVSSRQKRVKAKSRNTPSDDMQKGVIISVSDTGIGIPEENLAHVFDRFYQVDDSLSRNYQGTGIGLALTKELVELHKGSIWVESKQDEGTTFTFFLPSGKDHLQIDEIIPTEEITEIIADEESEGSLTILLPEDPDENGEKGLPILLIVEDNSDMRDYIRSFLEEEYNLFEAENGEVGLSKSIELIPDLIISDVMMPKMDGIEMCSRVKSDERTSHIPVVMLTARSSVEEKIEGLETGADAYIAKPFNAKELQVRVKNLIEQRQKLRERFAKSIGSGIHLAEADITSMDKQFMKKILEVVEEHLSDAEFTVEIFSQEMALSRVQLHRKLKALTGQSANRFLRTIRLKHAAELLANKGGNVTEAAFDTGFNNMSYFAKCFHEQFGMSPSDYVKNFPNQS